tara:strand:- start:247 stop:678 length:432 start_codon:yes stop_codon:yes gene_type:complete
MIEDNLGRLSHLLQGLSEAEKGLELAEKLVKDCKQVIAEFSEEKIPELMAELGIDEVKTNEGEIVKVEKMYFAKIPDKHKSEAFQWLTDNGMESVIKKRVVETEGVHHNTLKAIVKERYESGEHIPEDLFGIFVKNVTKVTKK